MIAAGIGAPNAQGCNCAEAIHQFRCCNEMGKSRRTNPPKIQARRNFAFDREGMPIYPRIIVRKPAHNDIHPLPRQVINVLLRVQKVEYLQGIKSIELKPRVSQNVGSPFGYYSQARRSVVLYSVPKGEWELRMPQGWDGGILKMYGATVRSNADRHFVSWPSGERLAYFMYAYVFLHELGHHYNFRYRHKRPMPGSYASEERSADTHAVFLASKIGIRLWRALIETGHIQVEWFETP